MKKIVEAYKCPNCSGKLEKSGDGSKMICPYCSSEFELEDTDDDNDAEEVIEKKEKASEKVTDWGKTEWIDPKIPFKKLCKGTDTGKLMRSFVKCINEYDSSEKILKHIKADLEKSSGVALKGYNDGKMAAFANRMKSHVDKDETPLIYGNTALLSNGKKGILITDKRTLVAGLSTSTLLHEDLDSIKFDNDGDTAFIYLNGSTKLSTILGEDPAILGSFVALICALSFEKNPGREKITICKCEDDDE